MEIAKDINIKTVTIGGITYSVDMATVLSADQSITSFQLERGVRYIGENAFANCQNLHVVRIPETVIRIEDFAFRDCHNLREVHLPYYMEYISPLAFTLSGEFGNTFFNDIKMCFPKEAFLKFAYMIPQFLSASDYEESGLTEDDFESVDGWDMFDGLPVCINEDELYRMAIKDYFQQYYKIGEETEIEADIIDADIQAACESAIEFMFTFGLRELIDEGELVDTRKHQIINSIDESFEVMIDHAIRDWLNFTPNMRPLNVIHMAMGESLRTGFIPASIWDKPDDKELYGDKLYGYLRCLYVDVTGGFYNEEVEKNEGLKEWYDKMNDIDLEVLLDCFLQHYTESGHLINENVLKRIVRLCMRELFHIGYSYGLKYRGRTRHELCMFNEEEMLGCTVTNMEIDNYIQMATVSPDDFNDAIVDDDGVTYSKDGKRLLKGVGLEKDYIVRDGTEVICNGAFAYIETHGIEFPGSLKYIGAKAFGYCRILNLPNGLLGIGDEAFFMSGVIEQLIIPNSVVHIGKYAFAMTCVMHGLVIGNGVERIEADAFHHISADSIIIGNSVKYLGNLAFAENYLDEIVIPPSVTEIEGNPFGGDINRIISLSEAFVVKDDILYSKDGKELICSFSKAKELVIPNSVEDVHPYAFTYSKSEIITLPNSVKTIGWGAFYRAKAIVVNLPDGLRTISKLAFKESQLESIVIPNTVECIEEEAFKGCESLKTVQMSDRIETLGESAFSYCSKLEPFELPKSLKSIGDKVFFCCYLIEQHE